MYLKYFIAGSLALILIGVGCNNRPLVLPSTSHSPNEEVSPNEEPEKPQSDTSPEADDEGSKLLQSKVGSDCHGEHFVQSVPISKTETIKIVSCEFYAYQGSYLVFVVSNTNKDLVTLLSFDQYQETITGSLEKIRAPRLVGLPTIKGAQLHVITKDRGIGDCGKLHMYSWNGSEFTLTEARYRSCEESNKSGYLPPEQWAIIK